MTDAELQAIEDRANAATLGPWQPKRAARPVFPNDVMTAADVGILSDALPMVKGVSNPIVGEVFAERTRNVREDDQAMRDAEFICHARTDVPALVAALRDARWTIRVNADMTDQLQAHAAELGEQLAHRDRTIAQLREIIHNGGTR